MQLAGYIDSDEVRKAIGILQAPGKVFEVRVIGSSGRKEVLSGYFRDADTLLKNFEKIDVRGRNIYITLGEVKEECFSRSQSEHFERNQNTTSDQEINAYRWLFIDLDPVRPTGISSSNQELEEARNLAEKVEEYLTGLGFREPVKALSGNGYHLLYKISLANDDNGRALVEKCLKNLSALFDTSAVKIDTTNSNPSRICKLHGTLAQKGTSTESRPHRMSKIISVPDEIKTTPVEILQRLATDLDGKPPERKPYKKDVNVQQTFDLLSFMSQNGMTYREGSNDQARIFFLDECPFDASHKNGDARIFQYRDGAIAFKCHHNSCHSYKWQDVRLKYDPNAYDHSDDEQDGKIDAGWNEHKKQQSKEPTTNDAGQKKTFRKLKNATELMLKDIPDPVVYVGVGDELPILVEGTCILSAKPKLGKSWLALGLCIAVAKGEDFLGYHTKQCSTLYLDLETSEALQQRRLRKMLRGEKPPEKFYLDTETDNLESGFVDQIEYYLKEDPDIGIVVIDVFQIIRSSSKNIKETEYEHAYRDITPLNELAQKHHISIILVCHDRKAVDPDDPFSNILGSTGLQGAATQMIVMFKKQKDDPIHISVKGKTIDGLPDLNVELENAEWKIVDAVDTAERERTKSLEEFKTSIIRQAVLEIAENNKTWKGRCSTLINEAIGYGVPITAPPKEVGGFLHRHQGHFLKEDSIQVVVIDNGTGSKTYRISKSTVDTVDENEELPLINFEEADKYGVSEIPFL